MKYIAGLIVLFLASCSVPEEKDRIDIILKNQVDVTLEVRAQAGFFGRTLVLTPGMEWKGWIPKNFDIKEIQITIKKPKKKTVKK